MEQEESPPKSRIQADLAPWVDNPSAWMVLLSVLVVWISALLTPLGGPELGGLPVFLAMVPATAFLFIAARASRLPDLAVGRRAAWALLAVAVFIHASMGAWQHLPHGLTASSSAASLEFARLAFYSVAAVATLVLLRSTRQQAAGVHFWLDAVIVTTCLGAFFWYAVLPDLRFAAPGSMTGPAQQSLSAWFAGALVVVAALLLLRSSDWQGWPGLAWFSTAAAMLAGHDLAVLVGLPQAWAGPAAVAGYGAAVIGAHVEYVRAERSTAPRNAAERGSPIAPAVPFIALSLAIAALLAGQLHDLIDPAAVMTNLVCFAVILVMARQVLEGRRIAERHATLATRVAEDKFGALIRNSADVIAIVGKNCSMQYVTPSVERVFGESAERMTGRDITRLVAQEDRPRLREFLLKDLAAAGSTASLEVRVPRSEDKHRVVEILGCNLLDDPSVRGIVLNLKDSTDRKGLEEQLRRLAFHDPLTLLANRALFRDRVEHALTVAKRAGNGVGVLFIDLDNFKKINDSLGHGQGDRVLRTSAQRLVKCTRTGDTVARLGGDEFAVLVENLTGHNTVIEIAERIVAALQEPFPFLGSDLRVAASVGVAFATPEDSVEELMRNADVAMYSAKAQGKGRYCVFEAQMQRVAHERLEIEAELSRALTRNEFQIHYQPIVDLQSGYLLGVEALVRWRHPKRGIVGPSEFIGVAEDSGLMVGLGRWVLREACKEVCAWQKRVPQGKEIRVAINVSAAQLEQCDLYAEVTAALSESGLDAGSLVLEITETVIMQNTEATLSKLTRLKKLGVRIAIDDFGTGYSSLSYLHRFPIDILKIDRSFVERLGGGQDGAALARAIITLGETLGLEVVAEGIEMEHQQRELIELGCVAGQGYYYSRPALLHELEYSVHMLRRKAVAQNLPEQVDFTATGRFMAPRRMSAEEALAEAAAAAEPMEKAS